MSVLSIFLTLVLAFFTWQLLKLYNNYVIAKKIGIPVLLTPFGVLNPIWQLGRWLPAFLKLLPFGCGSFADYDPLSSYLPDRYHRHAQLGDAYIVVSPSGNVMMVADSEVAVDILSRRKDFIKHPMMYEPLNIFGPNVDTLNGEDWQRHRRLTAPPFNERNSGLVWKESLKQAKGMQKIWLKANPSGVRRMDKDTSTLALHVLTGAGFGKSYSFDEGSSKPGPGHTFTYRDALSFILQHIFTSIILSMATVPDQLLFGNFLKVKEAIRDFGQYMSEMVKNERQAVEKGEKNKDNLISVLIRSADADKAQNGRSSMSDQEIYGNFFIYHLAGHDTSAGVLHHSIILLAAYPEVQDWIYEELASSCPYDIVNEWEYVETYPRLKRCLAVMYETVRFIGAVPMLPKHTDKSPQTITLKGRQIFIPAETFVFIQLAAVHSKPEYWGSDSLEWRPTRWLSSDSEEKFLEHTDLFFGWSGGPRVCPGKKFAQVEFVATIATLFRRHRVKPVLRKGESVEAASQRLITQVQDCNLGASFKVHNPDSLSLTWEERA